MRAGFRHQADQVAQRWPGPHSWRWVAGVGSIDLKWSRAARVGEIAGEDHTDQGVSAAV